MKTIDDFESDVVELYDELQSTLERVEDRREVTRAELMCVLAGMLCTTAKESGISSEELMWTMKMNYQKSLKSNTCIESLSISHMCRLLLLFYSDRDIPRLSGF